MKKVSMLVLVAVLMISLFGCSESKEKFKSEYSGKYDYYEKAVSLFKKNAGLTDEEADNLFGRLNEKGMKKAPSSFIQMTDSDGVKYYNLTSGLEVYKVYLTDGTVDKILLQTETKNEKPKDTSTEVPNTSKNETTEDPQKSTETETPPINDSNDKNQSSADENTEKNEDTPPAVTQTPPETTPSKGENSIKLLSLTSPVSRNQKATLEIKGKPNTLYKISVYYSSGASTASGLEAKTSDSSGYVSWTWKIGAKTKAGNHRITITGGGDTLETSIETN